MLGKKINSMKNKLAKKAKIKVNAKSVDQESPSSSLEPHESLLVHCDRSEYSVPTATTAPRGPATPPGAFAVYVGEGRRRFVVPTGYLSHPLFKMLLEKAQDEFGFEQKSGLVLPCSVNAFQQVVSAIDCCNGHFDFGDFVEEFH